MRRSNLWPEFVESIETQAREVRAVQQVTLIDQLEECVTLADNAWRVNDSEWSKRLSSLVRCLPVLEVKTADGDMLFRRSGGGGGTTERVGSFLRLQIERLKWAPSTLGPISPKDGFLRLQTRRFVSRGTSEEELGDLVMPYVVVQQLDDYTRLVDLGFEPLEDGAASAAALARFIHFAGIQLPSESARESLLNVRGRWRLLRGAIQEAYRTLNQGEQLINFRDDVKLAARVAGCIEFLPRPLYFAEAGSAVERAFGHILPLLDADRVYQRLFERLGIKRLLAGQTIEEEFCDECRAAPSSALRNAIVERLGPYLMAVIIARCEDRSHHDLVLRRLKERFDVQTADRLTVEIHASGF